MINQSQKGFTLFEVVIVVVIIGIIMSFAGLTLPDTTGRKELQQETHRLMALLKLAHDEAIINNVVMGMKIQKRQYQFQYYRNSGWQEAITEGVFRQRSLAENFKISAATDKSISLTGDSSAPPEILFWPSGEQTAFKLKLTFENAEHLFYQEIIASYNGEYSLSDTGRELN